eukprot:COSAG02_NODE_939_length_15774_cov_4.701180_8_plen_164_part_00
MYTGWYNYQYGLLSGTSTRSSPSYYALSYIIQIDKNGDRYIFAISGRETQRAALGLGAGGWGLGALSALERRPSREPPCSYLLGSASTPAAGVSCSGTVRSPDGPGGARGDGVAAVSGIYGAGTARTPGCTADGVRLVAIGTSVLGWQQLPGLRAGVCSQAGG